MVWSIRIARVWVCRVCIGSIRAMFVMWESKLCFPAHLTDLLFIKKPNNGNLSNLWEMPFLGRIHELLPKRRKQMILRRTNLTSHNLCVYCASVAGSRKCPIAYLATYLGLGQLFFSFSCYFVIIHWATHKHAHTHTSYQTSVIEWRLIPIMANNSGS